MLQNLTCQEYNELIHKDAAIMIIKVLVSNLSTQRNYYKDLYFIFYIFVDWMISVHPGCFGCREIIFRSSVRIFKCPIVGHYCSHLMFWFHTDDLPIYIWVCLKWKWVEEEYVLMYAGDWPCISSCYFEFIFLLLERGHFSIWHFANHNFPLILFLVWSHCCLLRCFSNTSCLTPVWLLQISMKNTSEFSLSDGALIECNSIVVHTFQCVLFGKLEFTTLIARISSRVFLGNFLIYFMGVPELQIVLLIYLWELSSGILIFYDTQINANFLFHLADVFYFLFWLLIKFVLRPVWLNTPHQKKNKKTGFYVFSETMKKYWRNKCHLKSSIICNRATFHRACWSKIWHKFRSKNPPYEAHK